MSKKFCIRGLAWFLSVLLAAPALLLAQQPTPAALKQEELDQVVAPIALLVAQINSRPATRPPEH